MPGLNHNTFWITLAIVLAAAAGAVGLYVLTFRTVENSWRVLAEARAELAALEQKRREVVSLVGHMEDSGQAELIARSFADPGEPLAFIQSIEELGRRFDVEVELSLASGAGTMRVEAYDLLATGPFESIIGFGRGLESLPSLIELGDAELARLEAPPGAPEAPPVVRLSTKVRLIIP